MTALLWLFGIVGAIGLLGRGAVWAFEWFLDTDEESSFADPGDGGFYYGSP